MIEANGKLRRTPSGSGAFGVVNRKVYLCQGEKPFAIKRKQRLPYTNRSTIVRNAGSTRKSERGRVEPGDLDGVRVNSDGEEASEI